MEYDIIRSWHRYLKSFSKVFSDEVFAFSGPKDPFGLNNWRISTWMIPQDEYIHTKESMRYG